MPAVLTADVTGDGRKDLLVQKGKDTLMIFQGTEGPQMFDKKSVETSDSDTEKLIINLWKNYSKAFEYKDYNKVASFFTFPATFGISSTPTTFNYKDELIDRYKLIREVNMQEGYKYSLLENHEFYQLSQNICLVKATYSRYDGNYNKIYTGKGVYFYKNVNGSWKLYAVDSL